MQNVETTIISQYSTSPTLVQLVVNMNGYIDPAASFDDFYNLIWNIDTAQGHGLDIWGRILGITRVVPVPLTELFFGFNEATTASAAPFNQGTFYVGGSTTNNFALSDEAYRLLLFAKALANITDGSIPSINQILRNLFPDRGNCYVTDGLDMTMTYTFEFPLTSVELAIVSVTGVLPRPCGVSATVVQS